MMPPQPEHEGAIAGAPYPRNRRVHRSAAHLRPRVLQLLSTGGSGGAQESFAQLLLNLDRTRYDVEAVSLSPGVAVNRLRRLGVEVDVLDETDDAAAIARLAERLNAHEIDVLHAHMFRAEVVGTRAALAAGTPVIVATVHSSRVRETPDVDTLRELSPHIDRLIVPSRAIAAKVAAEGRSPGEMSVIPNGIPLERFTDAGAASVRHHLGIGPDEALVGVVARLEPEKGHRYLVAAVPLVLRECPGVRFAIVGDGSLATELEDSIAALPGRAAERVVLTGRRDDVVAVTAALDVAVLPSLREAQGISLLEAMALGKPVVASAVGGIPEVVAHGREGLLVPPADPARLADAIVTLVRDASLRARLGEAGRRKVAEQYSVQASVRRIEAVYDEELRRAGRPPAEQSPGSTSAAGVTARTGSRARRVPPDAPPV